MQTFAIVELEEGGLNVVVGGRDGQQVRVVRSVRVPVAELGRESLTNALRSIGSDTLQGVTTVRVVLGERRMQHFLATTPKLSAHDAVKFVTREGLRLTGMQSTGDVLLATQLVRRLPQGKLALASTAIARSVWEPMRDAFAANGLEVVGLHSMESCLALAADGGSGDAGAVAVLECNAGRARFVLCDAHHPVQVRRFLIGGGENNASALATQLVMELPRTFEWLREISQPLPRTLVLGHRVGLEDEALQMLRSEELPNVVRSPRDVVVDDDQAPPSLATCMLLKRLCGGRALPSLLDEPRIELPASASRLVGTAVAVLVGVAGSWSAVVDGMQWIELHERCEGVKGDNLAMAGALGVEPESDPVTAPRTVENERLVHALSMRRPVSKLVRDVSNCADSELHIEDLKFASVERVVVTGIVQGTTRQDALKSIARFSRQLADIPYVATGGDEEITEVPRLKNCFKFRLGMKWRNG